MSAGRSQHTATSSIRRRQEAERAVAEERERAAVAAAAAAARVSRLAAAELAAARAEVEAARAEVEAAAAADAAREATADAKVLRGGSGSSNSSAPADDGTDADRAKVAQERTGQWAAEHARAPGGGAHRDGGCNDQDRGLYEVRTVLRDVDPSAGWPTLTKTNYVKWAGIMKVRLQVRRMWEAVQDSNVDHQEDRRALDALIAAVPPEMQFSLSSKRTAKEAWDAIAAARIGSDRARKSTLQALRKEWESLAFKPEVGVKFGDATYTEERAVEKLFRCIPEKYKQMARSIESLLDLSTMTIEEAIGRLKVVDTDEPQPSSGPITTGGKLLLAREPWDASLGDRKKGEPSSTTGGHKRGKQRKTRRGPRAGHKDVLKVTPTEAPRTAPLASPSRHKTTVATTVAATPVAKALIHLDEPKAHALLGDGSGKDKTMGWCLDTGTTHHMTGRREFFAELDSDARGSVKFGDASAVEFKGVGSVILTTKTGEHRLLTGVYYIPALRNSIISLGQLDENGSHVLIEHGVLRIWDRQGRLLAKVPRGGNRLYVLDVQVAQPVCLAVRRDDEAWQWHERFGHLHFEALKRLSAKAMVRGLPCLDHVEQFCDICVLTKQRRLPFPQQASFRAKEKLELMPGDLCGPMTPATPGGRRYFLLLVDDLSRYMWAMILGSKGEAADAIRRAEVGVEAESGRKLRVLRTDNGGEFTAAEFASYCADEGI
ncbi:uncharacterized protein [Aegilops tauschii subsp. strangulata]|uniref:uncharacterized protein n=1 Tax=Aegilops tauschii subsp. strangulata TaxID=200361 RepID=UPI00098A1295